MIPRNVRNNNPGNLDRGQPWQGTMPEALMSSDQAAETRFTVFKTPAYGFRAMAVLLRNYRKEYNAQSIRQIIQRWAPPSENNTNAYVEAVASECRIGSENGFDLTSRSNMFALCKAVTRHETGSWEPYWSDVELAEGLNLAGFAADTHEPAVPPLAA